ncbi:hypothetical protein QVD17_02808 [Tagetes erecta]|uniref:DUF7870 domain-containing protein n=1 Tax=Tagetes erecta TaxID=13708 RepID=A0AAD8L9V2_TARER|nr:hypothetical protein QVD17_02808 [Tagetes erecta]
MDPGQPFIPTMINAFRFVHRHKSIIKTLYSAVFFFLAMQIYVSYNTTNTEPDYDYFTDTHNEPEFILDEQLVQSYATVFQELMDNEYLTVVSRSIAVGINYHEFKAALVRLTVWDSVSEKTNELLNWYVDESFDFQFLSHTSLDCSSSPGDYSFELLRTLKPEGYLVIHTQSKDEYSLNSLVNLFESLKFVHAREVVVDHWSVQGVREVVFMKENETSLGTRDEVRKHNGTCFVPACKKKLVKGLEPLMVKEPLKPRVSGKRNRKNLKYLTSMVDVSFKTSYVYIDVGAKSYGTSIGSWFKKVYPKQSKAFKIFAIEADKQFHREYKSKKKVTLLPFAAWVRNESLFFEINHGGKNYSNERGQGMGRVQSGHRSNSFMRDGDKIQGFDFADWLKNSFSEKDFVVVKMDAEGREFDLIAKMVESGAICLIDELFLECHYDPKEKCCDGENSSNYQKGYGDCLELYRSLRDKGVFVHQGW